MQHVNCQDGEQKLYPGKHSLIFTRGDVARACHTFQLIIQSGLVHYRITEGGFSYFSTHHQDWLSPRRAPQACCVASAIFSLRPAPFRWRRPVTRALEFPGASRKPHPIQDANIRKGPTKVTAAPLKGLCVGYCPHSCTVGEHVFCRYVEP